METPVPATPTPPPVESPGFWHHAKQRKHPLFQWLLMGGILLFSMKTAGQKYRIDALHQEISALEDENLSLQNKLSKLEESAAAAPEPYQ